MCHLFLRLSRSSGEGGRACWGLHVSRRGTAAGQTRVKQQARGLRADTLRPPTPLFSHVCLTPRGFLAGVGEVGIESLSPDSCPDLVGCYPVIFQISLHQPLLATQVSSQKTEQTERRGKRTTYVFPPHRRIPTTNKTFIALVVLGTTQDFGYKMNKIILHCCTQRLAISQSAL